MDAKELLDALNYGTYTNAQFWEAHELLSTLPEREWKDVHVNLQNAWCEAEMTRIAAETHCGPDGSYVHNGRFWA